MLYITLHSIIFNLIFIRILWKRKLTVMIPTRRTRLIAKRRNCGNRRNGNATNQSGVWRVQSEYTHEHPETGCTLTFDKYLTLFAWLNKLFFVDFAATNATQRDWKKLHQGQRVVATRLKDVGIGERRGTAVKPSAAAMIDCTLKLESISSFPFYTWQEMHF